MPTHIKTALAPMATLSHEALRLLIHRFGDPDEYYTEMIHAPSLLSGGKFEAFYVRTAPAPEKIVWQLTGARTEPLCRAAALLAPLGGIGVDLNMGCSAPAIVRTGAGVSWMTKPVAETAAMVSAVRRAVDSCSCGGRRARLSVKLRIGVELSYPKLLDFCNALVGAGVDMITLHPRTKKEKYSRPPHWDFVAKLAADVPVPVFGNGDIFSAERAFSVAREFPCAGVMIGRAAVQKPWIFRDIRQPETEFPPVDHMETAAFFVRRLEQSQPPEFHISRARRFFSYYCDNFTFAHYVRTRVLNADSTSGILDVLSAYFAENPADRFTGGENPCDVRDS